MKNIYKFIMLILVATSVTFFSCQEDPDYPALVDLGTNPTFVTDVAATNVADTGFTMTITSSITGVAYYVVTTAGSVEEAPTYIEIIDEDVEGTVKSGTLDFETADPVSMIFTDLDIYTSYDVFAVMTNDNGLSAQVSARITITTTDNQDPSIESFVPAVGGLAEIDEDIVITFNENVTYVSGKTLTLTSDFGGFNEVVASADILVVGNVVTISHSDWPYSDYINLEMEAGAFIDASGNESEEIFLWPTTPNYWFETKAEIDFTNLVGGFYVSSENEIGFGSGERGGYFVNIEQEDATTLVVYSLRFNGAELYLTLNPVDNSITVADQPVVYHEGYGEDIYGYDTDPFGIGAGSGYVPGSYDEVTGNLSFYVYYYISLGQFGFYTCDLVKAEIPDKQAFGPGNQVEDYVQKFQ